MCEIIARGGLIIGRPGIRCFAQCILERLY